MIVGNGMMAKQFADYKDNKRVLIFASGVSNSKETNTSAFQREFDLLQHAIQHNQDKHFVYFSTSSMHDPMSRHSPYVLHKLAMEKYIENNCKSYNVFRISQVIGRANNSTLVNFIINNILLNKEFEVWEYSTRNLIALKDVYQVINYILTQEILINKIINIANYKNISILKLIEIIEVVLKKQAKIKIMPIGFPFDNIDIEMIKEITSKLNIKLENENYYHNAVEEMLYS